MMKWIRRGVLLLIVLACVLAAAVLGTALDSEKPVGFQVTQAVDEGGQAFAVGVWYPTTARPWPTTWLGLRMMKVARDAAVAGNSLPLVLISHGNGGGPGSHADLALALASAGYVVAAPMHAGDNFADQSAAGTVTWLGARSRQLRASVDHMLQQWEGRTHIDAQRIGVFGFSAGGATVLTALGARPDLRGIAAHCAATPEFLCDLLREGRSPLLDPALAQTGNRYSPDARIRAAVVAAPGLGFLMEPDALGDIRTPVQLWSGEQDTHVPYATNTRMVRDGLGPRAEFHSVPGAAHFAFLVPCGLLKPALLCTDGAGFDRDAFHKAMNASVIAFFGKHLRSLPGADR